MNQLLKISGAIIIMTVFAPINSKANLLRVEIPDSMFISAKDKTKLENRLLQIESLVPPLMKQAFSHSVRLQFKRITVHGYTNRHGLVLNENLLSELTGNFNRSSLLNRTVLHELAHAYDQLALIPLFGKQMRHYCQQENQRDVQLHPECAHWNHFTTSLSTNPFYLGKAGWLPNSNTTSVTSEKNYFSFRSPDEYELKNPQEHFAVNFEHFATDPDYKCRRPTLYQYFKNHFKFEPFQNISCFDTYTYVQPGNHQEFFHSIDIKRLYKIDYLYGTETKAMMSKWGHGMLRLVICAPNKPLNDTCYLDTAHHLVLSYRAFVNTPEISAIDGLTGKYPSRVFITSFMSVISEYNVQELRDLKALPLNFSPEENHSIVQRAIEAHWSYSSLYYFKSNNCATETFNLLRSSVNRANLFEYNPLHPKDLWEILLESKLADSRYFETLSNKKMAKAKGLLFESYGPRYLAALDRLKINLSHSEYQNQPFQVRQKLTGNSPSTVAEAAAILILEESTYLAQRSKIIQRASKSFIEQTHQINDSENAREKKDEFRKMVTANSIFSAPYMLLVGYSNSYGLPSGFETKKITEKLAENQKLINDFAASATKSNEQATTPEEDRELKRTYENIKLIYKKLEQLMQIK